MKTAKQNHDMLYPDPAVIEHIKQEASQQSVSRETAENSKARLIASIQKILNVKSSEVLDEGAFKHIKLFANRAMSIAKTL